MNLIQLKVFISVTEEHSFSRAAERIHLSQPTVSAHIQALEQELHTKLFGRGGREIQVLDAARRLYPYAKRMVETEQEILKLFEQESGAGQKLRIGASSIPGQYVLPDVLQSFSRHFPEMQIAITQSDSRRVLEGLREEVYDLGFVGTKIPWEGLEFIPFYEDELVVITADTDHYRQYRDELPPSVLEQTPVILREEGSGTRTEAEQYLRQAGVCPERLQVVAVMDNPENIKKAVERDMGISFLSRLAARDYEEDGRLRMYALKGISMKRQLYMVKNKNMYRTKQAQYLLELVQGFEADMRLW